MHVYVYIYVCICVCVCKYACMRITLVCLSMVECYFKPARLVHSAQSFSQHYRSVFQTHWPPRREMGILRSLLLFVVVMVTAISRKYAEAAESKFSVLIKSGAKLCAADPPFVTKENVTLVHCATRCASLNSCAHFNYKKNEKTCEIYLLKPECYLSTPTCAHYQVN